MSARGRGSPAKAQPYRSWLVAYRDAPEENWTWALTPMTEVEATEHTDAMQARYTHVVAVDLDTVVAELKTQAVA